MWWECHNQQKIQTIYWFMKSSLDGSEKTRPLPRPPNFRHPRNLRVGNREESTTYTVSQYVHFKMGLFIKSDTINKKIYRQVI